MTLPAPAGIPRLSRGLFTSARLSERPEQPERVLQFGEGNFLRAFVDWMITRLNDQGKFNGRVVVVQPLDRGMADILNEQGGLYTVILRGLDRGEISEERKLVESVSRAINPYRDHNEWIETSQGPDFRFVVSNTTEAGIALDPGDALEARPSPSFPGKLTQWLYARYRHFNGDPHKGVIMLPCELIERNGEQLRLLVEELIERWELPKEFTHWVRDSCLFTSTLVDRIVTGYPRAEAESICAELGYEDTLLVAGEIYHLWVIESPQPLESELPLREASLNVIWTKDAAPYREQKVRILNGTHTAMTLVGLLAGFDTVGACMADKRMRAFVEGLLAEEITPFVVGDVALVKNFADAVIDRFQNPFVRHELASIALNSVSKFRARLLGSFTDFIRARAEVPPRLTLALAALIVLYGKPSSHTRGANISILPNDEPIIIELFEDTWARYLSSGDVSDCGPLVKSLLASETLWGRDLTRLHPRLIEQVQARVQDIVDGRISSHIG